MEIKKLLFLTLGKMEILKDLQRLTQASILKSNLQSAHNLQRFMDLNIKFQISRNHTKDTYTLEELQAILNDKINNKN